MSARNEIEAVLRKAETLVRLTASDPKVNAVAREIVSDLNRAKHAVRSLEYDLDDCEKSRKD